MIEFDDFSARRLIPKLEEPRHQTFSNKLIDQTDSGNQFESRGVSGCRSRVIVNPILGFEERYRIAILCAGQR